MFDSSQTLLVMRPYQIAALSAFSEKSTALLKRRTGQTRKRRVYLYTTGSGKTLTSLKAARLATELDFIDKVFFVVDLERPDYQTMKEVPALLSDSVNGSDNTAGLRRNRWDDNKIIVTTIQKLNLMMKAEADLPVYQQQVGVYR
ncbi:DEAD/DEAH box helicase family protein [Serratia ureilytica]